MLQLVLGLSGEDGKSCWCCWSGSYFLVAMGYDLTKLSLKLLLDFENNEFTV